MTILTPSQTIGPFFRDALHFPAHAELVPAGTSGALTLAGTVYDGEGAGIADALVEIWHAGPDGTFPAGGVLAPPTGFRGFGRCATDADGRYEFRTLRPGSVDGAAPHLAMSVFARGLLHRVVTRVFLPDEPTNAADPLLASLPESDRATLIAEAVPGGLTFDVRLQGAGETVFLAFDRTP